MTDVRLYRGDCLEVMKGLPDDCVDAVVTDPPYVGLIGGYDRSGVGGGVGERAGLSISLGDEWQANLEWVSEAKRVARLGAIVFCSYHALPEVALAFTGWRRVILLNWYKRNAPPTGKNVPRFDCEHIWCFAKRPGLRWDAFATGLLDIPTLSTGCFASAERVVRGENKRAVHPAQKPIAVIKWLLSCEPETVLYPFMGLGTTGVACVQAGRKFIGIEIDPTYYAIAEKRIAEAQLRPRLSLTEAAVQPLQDELL